MINTERENVEFDVVGESFDGSYVVVILLRCWLHSSSSRRLVKYSMYYIFFKVP